MCAFPLHRISLPKEKGSSYALVIGPRREDKTTITTRQFFKLEGSWTGVRGGRWRRRQTRYRRIWSNIDRCQCGDSHDYTILGSTTRLSSQLAREIRFDCPFALMFFRYFFHISYSPTLILPTFHLATVYIRPDSTV